jgi:uncharacterized protein YqcC (DUF446 family)
MADAASVRARLDAVVAAMRESGAWDAPQPERAAFENMGAFGMRTMAFAQWLRWVFVPRVEETLAAGGPWPSQSMVAVQAMREGDTDPAIAALVDSLSAFDALFSRPD